MFILGPEGQWAARVVDLRAWRVRIDESRIMTFNGEPFYPLNALEGLSEKYEFVDAHHHPRFAARRLRGLDAPGPPGDDDRTPGGPGRVLRLRCALSRGRWRARAPGRAARARPVRPGRRSDHQFPGRRRGRGGAGIRAPRYDLHARSAAAAVVLPAGRQPDRGRRARPAGALRRHADLEQLRDRPELRDFSAADHRRPRRAPLRGRGAARERAPGAGAGASRAVRDREPAGGDRGGRAAAPGHRPARPRAAHHPELLCEPAAPARRPVRLLLRARLRAPDYQRGELRLWRSARRRHPPLRPDRRADPGGHGEASAGRQGLGAGSYLLLGNYGLLSAGLLGSRDGDDGLGTAGLLEYEYSASRFSVGLRTRLASDDFRQLGLDDEEGARRVDQFSLGLGLHPFGRLGLLFVNAEGRGDFEDQRSISASYSLPLGFASVLFSALQTIEPERDLALVANLSIPLSPERSLTATGQYDGGDRRGRLEYRRSRGSSDLGPSYRLATEFGDDPRRLDGSLRYDAALASGQVDVEYWRRRGGGARQPRGLASR